MRIEKAIIVGTFGSLFSVEQVQERLKRLQDVVYKVIDGRTLIVRIRDPRDEALRQRVCEIILSCKGYVEPEISKAPKDKKGKIGPLDYPIFG